MKKQGHAVSRHGQQQETIHTDAGDGQTLMEAKNSLFMGWCHQLERLNAVMTPAVRILGIVNVTISMTLPAFIDVLLQKPILEVHYHPTLLSATMIPKEKEYVQKMLVISMTSWESVAQ